MHRLINSPQNTGKTEPLAYIDATRAAGYDGIGIRTYRAPGRTYNFNPINGNKDLERDVKTALGDSGLEVYDLYSFYLQPEMDWDAITPALEYGGEIGCKYVLVIGDDDDWSRMVATMGRMIDIIEPLGMKAVFEAFVREKPLVRECWMLSGEIDFILKCVAPDLRTFQAFVAELTAAPHVRNVKTSLALKVAKDAAIVPMGE